VCSSDLNDLSGNIGSKPQPGFGIRLMDTLPGQSDLVAPTHITVDVSNNTLDHDALGVAIDAGFPFRVDPLGYVGTVTASFNGNAITNFSAAPAVVTFNRYTASMCGKELAAWQYLHNSTYTISDPGRDLRLGQPNGALIDNPANDPIDGHPLGNTLLINGEAQPTTMSSLQDRILADPTCA